MSAQEDRVLALLDDGAWHRTGELVEIGHRFSTSVQTLREAGHNIQGRRLPNATDWEYRLLPGRWEAPPEDSPRAVAPEFVDVAPGLWYRAHAMGIELQDAPNHTLAVIPWSTLLASYRVARKAAA